MAIGLETMTRRLAVLSMLLFIWGGSSSARTETPEDWVKLLTRVHGGFGSFLPVGIRIGEDAMKRLDAKPRELSVVFYQGEGTPCPCAADGVMLTVFASPGQGTLVQINSTIQDPLGRYNAVMALPDPFTVEPVN